MLKRWWLAAISLLVAGACTGTSPQEQTQAVQIDGLNTQMADLHQTSTVEADRMSITLEHARTEMKRAENLGTDLASTLVARGFDPSALANITPVGMSVSPSAVPAPLATQSPGAESTAIPVTPFTVTPTEPPPPRLSNIVLSEGVGDNDCALNAVSQFSTATKRIYVVAVANNVQPGTTLVSRWQQEGVEQAALDWTPDFYIEQDCIWFFIDQADAPFTPGNWSVTLEIDGQPAGAPVAFTIVE